MASEEAGSEAISELFCQPCMDDGEHLPAEGYCTDCREFLCSTCATCHRKGRAYKNHTLQNKSQMPKSQVSSATMDTCAEQCPKHKGELISFYCKSHDLLGCQRCKAIGHVGCQVDIIADVSKGISESPEYKEIMEKFCRLKQRYDDALGLSKTHMGEIEEYYLKAKDNFETVITKLKEEDLKKMKSIKDTSSAVIEEIQGTTTKLEALQRTNQNSQMFVVMKNTSSQMKLFEESLCKVETDNKINRYEFKVLEQSVKGSDVLGQLSMLSVVSTIATAGNMSVMPVLPMKPVSVRDINIKSTTDTSSGTNVTGSCLLPGNQLVVTDHSNKKVKLVDLKQNKITSEVQLTSNPLDVTLIDNNQVAVTIYNEKTIQFLHTSSRSLSEGREIKVNSNCYGIVHNDGTLIVTFFSPGRVEMIDMNGRVLRSVSQDASGTQLFNCPQYVAISPDKTAIYVSDWSKHTVTCMSMDGTVKSVYKDDALKNPKGLVVDKTGVVYVGGFTFKNIHRITATCTKIQIILGQEHGIFTPYSLTYCDREDKLYVGMNNYIVKVFKLK